MSQFIDACMHHPGSLRILLVKNSNSFFAAPVSRKTEKLPNMNPSGQPHDWRLFKLKPVFSSETSNVWGGGWLLMFSKYLQCSKSHSCHWLPGLTDILFQWILITSVVLFPYLFGCGMVQISIILIHWGRDKMAAFFQTTFSKAFSSMKMYKS